MPSESATNSTEPPALAVTAWFWTMLWPALTLICEPSALAVIAALSCASWPAVMMNFEPAVLAVTAALISTSLPARSSSVCGVVQVTASATVIL